MASRRRGASSTCTGALVTAVKEGWGLCIKGKQEMLREEGMEEADGVNLGYS
jgi:hypothetical protein